MSIDRLLPLRVTGLHLKLGAGIVGAMGAYYFKQYRTAYLADKDAMYRQYMQLHPESFQAPGLYIDPTHFWWYSLQVNRVFSHYMHFVLSVLLQVFLG